MIFDHKNKNFEKNSKKMMFRHMTSYDASYDGKLRHLPHLGVSTVIHAKKIRKKGYIFIRITV
jgi:hypothetical protein